MARMADFFRCCLEHSGTDRTRVYMIRDVLKQKSGFVQMLEGVKC